MDQRIDMGSWVSLLGGRDVMGGNILFEPFSIATASAFFFFLFFGRRDECQRHGSIQKG